MKLRLKDVLITIIGTAVLLVAAIYSESFVPTGFSAEKFIPKVLERRDSMYGITVFGDRVVWLVGNNGKIVKSTDAGKTWENQESGTTHHLHGVSAWDEKRAVGVGNNGIVVVTTDGGASWNAPDVPKSQVANKLIKVKTLPNGQAWAVGSMGMVIATGDWGTTWYIRIPEEDLAWNDIAFADSRVGVMVGEFGHIKRTFDGGDSWQDVPSPVQSSLFGVAARDPDNWVAVGLDGFVLMSTDGGQSWKTTDQTVTQEHLLAVLWEGDRYIAVGNMGVVAIGNPAADKWYSHQLSKTELLWHTDMAKLKTGVFIVGGTQGILQDGKWSYLL